MNEYFYVPPKKQRPKGKYTRAEHGAFLFITCLALAPFFFCYIWVLATIIMMGK